jgi:sec-independent protein translocase protein TatA
MCLAIAPSFALLAFWSPGPSEMLLLALVALLLYGGELPQVARTWGRQFAEFRRGLSGIQREFNEAIYNEPHRLEYHPPTKAEPAASEPTTPGEPTATGEPASAGVPQDSTPTPRD